MPPTLTYPGVYIVEAPSGVQTITRPPPRSHVFRASVARANQYSDRMRELRRLHTELRSGNSRRLPGQMVQQFFANGGSDCFVVRIAGSNGAPPRLPQ